MTCRRADLMVTTVPSDLLCTVGHGVLVDPVAVTAEGCGHLFCGKCLSRHMTKSSECPSCHTGLSPDVIAPVGSDVRARLQGLSTRCENTPKGCKWTGTLGEVPDHLRDCLRSMPVKCDMCHSSVPRADITNHFGVCPRRPVQCPGCQQDLTADELPAHQASGCSAPSLEKCPHCQHSMPNMAGHLKRCPALPTDCSFGCGVQLPKGDIVGHEQTCPMMPSQCPFCRVSLCRGELDAHKKDTCSEGTTSCDTCKQQLKRKDMPKHQRKCGNAVPCDLCGQPVSSSQLMEHLKEECPKNVISCQYCRERMEREILTATHQHSCPLWPVKCEHCDAEHTRKDTPIHLTSCPSVPVQCKLCKVDIARSEQANHVNQDCPLAPVACDACSQRVPRQELGPHAAVCPAREVTCPGCDEAMRAMDLETHQCPAGGGGIEDGGGGDAPPPAAAPTANGVSGSSGGGGAGGSGGSVVPPSNSAGALSANGGGGSGVVSPGSSISLVGSSTPLMGSLTDEGCPFSSVGCGMPCPGQQERDRHLSTAVSHHMMLLLSQVRELQMENQRLTSEVQSLRGGGAPVGGGGGGGGGGGDGGGGGGGAPMNNQLLLLDNRVQVLENHHKVLTAKVRSVEGVSPATSQELPSSTTEYSPPAALAAPAAGPGPPQPSLSPSHAPHRPSLPPTDRRPSHEGALDAQSGSWQVGASGEMVDDDGRVQCPNCGRKFNEDVAQRHIPVCHAKPVNPVKKSSTRPAASPKLGMNNPRASGALPTPDIPTPSGPNGKSLPALPDKPNTGGKRPCPGCGSMGTTRFCVKCGQRCS